MRLRRASGFTLIELMVVIVILGGLIALVGPDVFAALFKSNIKTAETQMSNFAQAIDLFRLDKKKLPGSLQDLTQAGNDRGAGAYMKDIPKDPWGNEYEYRANGNKDYTIRSYGDDGQPDTDDDVFWPPKKDYSAVPRPSARIPAAAAARGFTLLEMMVVCAILGAVLLLVPASFDGFGARSRLSSASNTILSRLTGAREQATLDGFEARLEIGNYADAAGGRHMGTRFWFTNLPAKSTQGNPDQREALQDRVTSRAQERQWLTSSWWPLPEGVVVSGVSLEAGQWEKIGEGDHTFQVHYFPDGGVDRGFGVRLECLDIEARSEERTVTILVNALTSEATSYEGFRELPRQRDAHEFH